MLANDIRAGGCYKMKSGATIIIIHVSSIFKQEGHLIKVFLFNSITCTQNAFTRGNRDVIYMRSDRTVEGFSLEKFNEAIDKFKSIHNLVNNEENKHTNPSE